MEIELYASWLFLFGSKQATGLISEKLQQTICSLIWEVISIVLSQMQLEQKASSNIEYWNPI